jgi:hypothetical protein
LSNPFTGPVNGAEQVGVDVLQHYLPFGEKFHTDVAALIHSTTHTVNVRDAYRNPSNPRGKPPKSEMNTACGIPANGIREIVALYPYYDIHGFSLERCIRNY